MGANETSKGFAKSRQLDRRDEWNVLVYYLVNFDLDVSAR